ncbi:hypothetical protein NEOLEDRAFT_705024 [Neolentinus lepideus HHB14362 ss-1]|uniref:Uncharacterized protein n=1 Tax=Neolentinus lepideus HHB14362 ss-1 TaxID=1314782 RepID=A0A165V5M2_9AGAM|nr:hypothetical protein NEOLEDRAFT_705024 [Neolentinus lepideus HHB14362 ss-1]
MAFACYRCPASLSLIRHDIRNFVLEAPPTVTTPYGRKMSPSILRHMSYFAPFSYLHHMVFEGRDYRKLSRFHAHLSYSPNELSKVDLPVSGAAIPWTHRMSAGARYSQHTSAHQLYTSPLDDVYSAESVSIGVTSLIVVQVHGCFIGSGLAPCSGSRYRGETRRALLIRVKTRRLASVVSPFARMARPRKLIE